MLQYNNPRSLSKFEALCKKQVFILWENVNLCQILLFKIVFLFFLTRNQWVFIIELLKNSTHVYDSKGNFYIFLFLYYICFILFF